MTSPAIGFVGLGNMGGRIARVLVDSGRPVLGYDLAADSARAAGIRCPETGGHISFYTV